MQCRYAHGEGVRAQWQVAHDLQGGARAGDARIRMKRLRVARGRRRRPSPPLPWGGEVVVLGEPLYIGSEGGSRRGAGLASGDRYGHPEAAPLCCGARVPGWLRLLTSTAVPSLLATGRVHGDWIELSRRDTLAAAFARIHPH